MHLRTRLQRRERRGLSLLETIVSVAIMMISLGAIHELMDLAGRQALEVKTRSLAAQECQSKLNEFSCGALGMNSQGGPCDYIEGWEWSVDAQQFEVDGLWQVTVTVRKTNSDKPMDEVSLSQIILDPGKRGNPIDEPPPPETSNTPAATPEESKNPNQQSQPMTNPMGQPMSSPMPMGGMGR
jgi:Tfp pilus assembly protein PilV